MKVKVRNNIETSISPCPSRSAWELLTHRPMSNERCDQEQRCFSCLLFSPRPFFIVFFRALHHFFPGCELWRVASLSLLTLNTQALTKLVAKKTPAFQRMNRCPAVSPLGDTQQTLLFQNGQTGRGWWPQTDQDLTQSDRERRCYYISNILVKFDVLKRYIVNTVQKHEDSLWLKGTGMQKLGNDDKFFTHYSGIKSLELHDYS